jgi:hypothetical protein
LKVHGIGWALVDFSSSGERTCFDYARSALLPQRLHFAFSSASRLAPGPALPGAISPDRGQQKAQVSIARAFFPMLE